MNAIADVTEAGWRTGPRDTPIAALRRAVAAHPEKIFLDFSGETHTYGEFDKTSNRFAHSLQALGLIAGAPLFFLTAALVKLDSPGPALFTQERMGLDGERFPVFKFRTMRVDAEKFGLCRYDTVQNNFSLILQKR
jgi:lipopolysaccharide/colanic/teichoic acid biosynthesis glycosyltransferase